MENNTSKLLSIGYLSVFFPVCIAIFGPPILFFIPMAESMDINFTSLALALLLGLILSFLVYRSTIRWWVNWAFNQASHPGELKRKALDARLITKEGETLLGNGYFLGADDLEHLDSIDELEVNQDDASVPPFLQFKPNELEGYSSNLMIVVFLFLIIQTLMTFYFPGKVNLSMAGFGLVIILFLSKKLKKKEGSLYVDHIGIKINDELIPWVKIKSFDIHFNPTLKTRTRLNFILLNETSRSVLLPKFSPYNKGKLRHYLLVYQYRSTQAKPVS